MNRSSSIYHALVLRVEKLFSHGVSFLVSYTGSKTIDNASGRIFGVNAFVPPVQNIYDLKAERAISEGDISQQLAISHVLELPFGKGNRLLSNAPAPVNAILGGWSLNGTATLTKGFPLV